MTDATTTSTIANEPKFTAKQIEENCPDRLQLLGNEIAARIRKADKQIEQAENHSISIDKLIAQAQQLCDEGGFLAFQKKFFPHLGKSRVYELLAIGTSKKSVEETRASTRARVAKYRANKAAASFSVTVTEKPEQAGAAQTTDIATEQTPEPSKPRSAVAPGDEALRSFTVRIMELHHRTAKRPPVRFAAAPVPVEVLERLGNLFIGIAKLKKSETAKSAPSAGGGVTSVEPSAEDVRIDEDLDARVAALLPR
jgi:hypothetical protein